MYSDRRARLDFPAVPFLFLYTSSEPSVPSRSGRGGFTSHGDRAGNSAEQHPQAQTLETVQDLGF